MVLVRGVVVVGLDSVEVGVCRVLPVVVVGGVVVVLRWSTAVVVLVVMFAGR